MARVCCGERLLCRGCGFLSLGGADCEEGVREDWQWGGATDEINGVVQKLHVDHSRVQTRKNGITMK